MSAPLSRRRLLKTGALVAGALPLAGGVWARAARSAARFTGGAGRRRVERVRLGVVGVWNRGWANLSEMLGEELVALCDVDQRHLGNAVRRIEELTDKPCRARRYADFRRMLDEVDLDAVVVSTPDHTHAVVAAAALRRGLHTYVEKPLAHSVHEVRALQELAAEKGLVTQLGTQIHAGENYRRVVELIRAGVIGEVREVHVWVGKAWGDGRFAEPKPVPDYLDWDLWQGPVAEREYSDGLHPANWRRFWDYGTGTLGDMACHYVDLVHWALDLGVPERVSAEGPPVHPVGTPGHLHVTWDHPARGERPAVRVHWYDGDLRPEGVSWDNGHLFVGSEGRLLSDYGRHQLLPADGFADLERPEPSLPPSIGHHREWLQGIREGTPTTCNFAYSGALTEAVLLGNAAYRTGQTLEWDAEEARAKNVAAAEDLVRPTFREGWEL